MSGDKTNFEDLVDFYNQWPRLRDELKSLSQGDTVTEEQARILQMVFHIVDCVGPHDLIPEASDNETDAPQEKP